jgi:hypothetical protein
MNKPRAHNKHKLGREARRGSVQRTIVLAGTKSNVLGWTGAVYVCVPEEPGNECPLESPPIEGEWPIIDPSSRRIGGPITKHAFWKEQKYGHGVPTRPETKIDYAGEDQ